MSRNPFGSDPAAPPAQSEDKLRALCHDHNRWAYKVGYRKWYYVEPASADKAAQIMTVDGISADEVWTVSRGGRIDYASWSQERIDKLERRCRWLVEHGMTQEAFEAVAARLCWRIPSRAAA